MRVQDDYTLMGMYDADYQYAQWEQQSFIIDRSDSMDADLVRIPTEPSLTIIKGHRLRRAESIGADKWVDTYGKFLNQLFVILFGVFMASCQTELPITQEDTQTTDLVPYLFEGTYEVSHKTYEYPDGKVKYFAPLGSNASASEIDGWFSQTTFTFSSDSLAIAQLMDNGWHEGSVSVKWKDGIPKKVGCRIVESANETQISWYQNDIIIRNYLIRL